ncbi:MAG: hypothetical protein ACTSVB_07935 [Candidatus Heimdallarchaeaceae archaeon]
MIKMDTIEIVGWIVVSLCIGLMVGYIYGYYWTMNDVCRVICNSNNMEYDHFSCSNPQEIYICHCKGVIKDVPIMDIVIGA